MVARYEDWFKQAQRDLEWARRASEERFFEWACFVSQQAAEKAVKALFQKIGAEAWGHSVGGLLSNLPSQIKVDVSLIDKAKELDKHYIPPRYPNAHPKGPPFEHYTRGEAKRAINYASEILRFCKDNLF